MAPEDFTIVLMLVMFLVATAVATAKYMRSRGFVTCRLCGRELSPRAQRCPKCGEPMAQ